MGALRPGSVRRIFGSRGIVRRETFSRGDSPRSQGCSDGKARGCRIDWFLLSVPFRSAPYAQSQTPPRRHHRHRRLRHLMQLRWAHRHSSLGRQSRRLASRNPRVAQRHSVTRLHSPIAHRPQAPGLPKLLSKLDHQRHRHRRHQARSPRCH